MIFMQSDIDSLQCSIILIVLESENLKRMEKADPVTLESGVRGGFLKTIKYPERIRLMVAFEKDAGPIYEMIQQERHAELLAHLMRGYEYKPLDGVAAKIVPKEVA